MIDGRQGFTGGMGIADPWLGNADAPEYWRDTHYQVDGPVVAQMQAAFLDNWMKTHATVLHGDAYFPLIAAVRRGVAVEVMLPGPHQDSRLVRGASRHRWGKLLENGVRIFECLPTMFHRKVMIIDDLWVSVGSANFDNRSFRLNDETNLNVFDSEFALKESAVFEKDKQPAREITWEQWKQRPMLEKVSDATVGLLLSQL